jgi:hypothetical protein
LTIKPPISSRLAWRIGQAEGGATQFRHRLCQNKDASIFRFPLVASKKLTAIRSFIRSQLELIIEYKIVATKPFVMVAINY